MKPLLIVLAMACISNTSPLTIKCSTENNKYTYTFSSNRDTLTTLFCVQSEDMLTNNINPYCKPSVFAYKVNAKWIDGDGEELSIDSTRIRYKSGFTMKCKPIKK